MVIFQKEVVIGSKSLWKSNFQTWALRIVYYTRWFSSQEITKYLHILNTSIKSIWESEETGNYSGYTKVLRNQVWSSIEIIRSHVISNGVIRHEKEPGWSVLEVVCRPEGGYPLPQMFWAEQSLGNHYLSWSQKSQMY